MTSSPPAKRLKQKTILYALEKKFPKQTSSSLDLESNMSNRRNEPGPSCTVVQDNYKESSSESDEKGEKQEDPSNMQSVTSLGSPLSEFNTYPSCLPAMGPLNSSANHTVLIQTPYNAEEMPKPFPSTFIDKWDADHVKLPCSQSNLYPVKSESGNKLLKNRWELIEQALLSNISSSLDLEEAILTYNTRYSQRWNFEGLHTLFTEVFTREEADAFFKNVLPKMIELALQLPQLCTQPIPMLKKQMEHSITMSQQQVACLLANAFFCTFPRRNTTVKQSEYSSYPYINFTPLFQASGHPRSLNKTEKLKCIINYFQRVTSKVPTGTITFHRQCVTSFPEWHKSSKCLCHLHVTSHGTIEDNGRGMLQVDFANKYVGGGVLNYGCVQEEIRFLICPELLVSRLFMEELDDNECLLVTGCERFSNYTGYSNSFKWASNHKDSTQRDPWGRICTQVVAIDALVFRSYKDQFRKEPIKREINKAYCGFVSPNTEPNHLAAIATGNWGCGAFGGDLRLKALLQLLAATEAHRDVTYFTYRDVALMNDLHKLHQFVCEKDLTVSDIYCLIMKYCDLCEGGQPSTNLYEYIYQVIDGHQTDACGSGDLSQVELVQGSQGTQSCRP